MTTFSDSSGAGLTSIPTSNAHRHSALELARENTIPSVAMGADPFWDVAEIDELRWDQRFPYQLILLTHQGGNRYNPVAGGTFTLPINPQSLTISTPFAVGLTFTQGGVVEEHNGAPLRIISAQGTTGVIPGRGAGAQVGTPTPLQSVFAGTISAAQGALQAASSLVPGGAFQVNTITDDDLMGELKGTTGYYQFLMLQGFLENYANLKKQAMGRKYRLAFAQWKTNGIYLVTLVHFDVIQTSASPLEYTWSLGMKAWRRIKLNTSEQSFSQIQPAARDPGLLDQILKGLQDARRAVVKVGDVIRAVGQDVNHALFEPLRQTILFLKDALGVPIACTDVPVEIVKGMKTAIIEAASLPGAWNAMGAAYAGLNDQLSAEFADLKSQIDDLSVQSGKSNTGSGSQSNTSQALEMGAPHPANRILENPDDPANFEFFEAIRPGSLNVPAAVTKQIVIERERVRLLQRINFEQFRDGIVALADAYADAVGMGNATYDRIYGRATTSTTKTPTESDFEAICQLNRIAMEMDRLAVSGEIGNRNRLSVLEYVAGLSGRAGISFNVPKSQFQVPVIYGATLEQMASRYLGDPERWHEIAALNRLRPPYVDETGFSLPLLVNGNKNQVVVDTAENFYVGQPVWVYSTIVSKSKRHITGIQPVDDSNVIVSLDGDADLDKYKTTSGAAVHAFLPDTVNSQMLLSIPSDAPPPLDDWQGKSISGVDQFTNLLAVGGIDLLLTPSGDAAITPDGDWKLAVGLQNLIQQVRVFAATPRGSQYHHPTWGLAIQAGQSTADVSAKDLLNSLKGLSEFNPAFTGIHSASVLKNGPTALLNATISIAGNSQLLPVSLELKAG